MKKIALFPGSFDPVTLGHVDIIKRVLPLVDQLYIGIGVNANKVSMFSLEKRLYWLEGIFKKESKIKVLSYEGLTVDLCRHIGAGYIVRGIRGIGDFEYEKAIADMNRKLSKEVETLFLFAAPEYGTLASSLVRDVIRNEGDVTAFIPKIVLDDLNNGRLILA